jgi:hypothetical protein
LALVGLVVRVRVVSGACYEGVMHAAKTNGAGLGVVLKQVLRLPLLLLLFSIVFDLVFALLLSCYCYYYKFFC